MLKPQNYYSSTIITGNQAMKTIVITLTLIVISMGWCATGCKQTTTQVTPEDTWVEITDTTHLSNMYWLSSVFSTWEVFTGLTVKDTSDYRTLTTFIDTSDFIYKGLDTNKFPIKLPTGPDFSRYSMVGFRYFCTIDDTIQTSFFVNEIKKQYRYWVRNISDPNAEKIKVGVQKQNWLLVPRLKQGYTVLFDTTTSGMGR